MTNGAAVDALDRAMSLLSNVSWDGITTNASERAHIKTAMAHVEKARRSLNLRPLQAISSTP